jgi:hypothetical protein
MRGNQPRPFQRLLSEREFKREEMEMLHRMTTLLSTVVIAFLAAPVLNAVLSTAARADDSCLARPTGRSFDGSRWFYQTNRVTNQKCWVAGGKETAALDIAPPRLLAFGGSNEVAERPAAAAASCIAAPNGRSPQGKHWVYRVDNETGRRCWRLGDQVARSQVSKSQVSKSHVAKSDVSRSEVSKSEVSRSKVSRNQGSGNQISSTGNAIPSPAPVTSDAPQALSVLLSRAIADANARLLDTSIAAPSRIELAASPAAAITEIADENVPAPTFSSRWTDLSEQARAPKPMGLSENPDDVTPSTKASGPLPAAERSLDVTLMIFLGSLSGALILFGLIGRSFYGRSEPPAWPHDILRVTEFDRPSSSNSPGDGAERGHGPESDWQIAMDAVLRLVGGRPADRDPPREQRRHVAGDRRVGDRRGGQFEDGESN